MEEEELEIPTKCHKEVAMKSLTIAIVLDQISLPPLSFRIMIKVPILLPYREKLLLLNLKIKTSRSNLLKMQMLEIEIGQVHLGEEHQVAEWVQQVAEVEVLVNLKDHRQPVHKMLDSEKFRKNLKMKEKKKEEWLMKLKQ